MTAETLPRRGAGERRSVALACTLLVAIVAAGAWSASVSREYHLGTLSLFFEQFAKIEPLHLAITAGFALAILALASRDGDATVAGAEEWRIQIPASRAALVGTALAAFAVVWIGEAVIFHHYYFIDDEYSAWFQANIFAHGKFEAAVPRQWCRWLDALTPTSVAHTARCTWHLSFLPIHSLIRGAFIALGSDHLAGPVTAAASLLLVAAIARKLWPDRPRRMWIAVAVLAVSTQFLFMSMTMYAMPTHLLFSLVWLWVYVQDSRWSIVLLPWVGFLALGVHSPTPHALWVAPFLLRFLRQRRFATVGYLAAVYALAVAFWLGYLRSGGEPGTIASASATVQTAGSLFSVPSALLQMVATMHLTLVATWNTPIALICVIAAMLEWRQLDTFSRDAALSLILTVLARAFMPTPQGGGWGYRYIYAGLGNFALLSACGIDVLAEALGWRATKTLLAASLAASVVIQIPLRGVQVERIVRPYYDVTQYLSHIPQRVVVFPAEQFAWGRMLIRNDPFLIQGPVLLDQFNLPEGGLVELERQFPDQVHIVTVRDIMPFGLPRAPNFAGAAILVK